MSISTEPVILAQQMSSFGKKIHNLGLSFIGIVKF